MYKHIATVSFIKQEGNGPTERASEAKSGLRFEISDLNYLDIHVHIAYMVPYDGLWGHYSLQTASEVKFGLNNLHFICDQILPLPYITSSLNFPRRENDPNHHLPLLRLKFRGPRLRAARNKALSGAYERLFRPKYDFPWNLKYRKR